MGDDIDEVLNRRAADLEASGKAKYGEKHWGLALGGLKRACVSVGVNPAEAVKAALAQSNSETLLYNVGREALQKRRQRFHAPMGRKQLQRHHRAGGPLKCACAIVSFRSGGCSAVDDKRANQRSDRPRRGRCP